MGSELSSCVPSSPSLWSSLSLPVLVLSHCPAVSIAPATWPAPALLPFGFGGCLPPSTLCLTGMQTPGERGQHVSRAVCGGRLTSLSRGTSGWTLVGRQGQGQTLLTWSSESQDDYVIMYVHFSTKPSRVLGDGKHPYVMCVRHIQRAHMSDDWIPCMSIEGILKVILMCLCSLPTKSKSPGP